MRFAPSSVSYRKTYVGSPAWEQQEALLKNQRLEMDRLQAAVRSAEEQLEVQRQELTKVVQNKEQLWGEMLEEVESR